MSDPGNFHQGILQSTAVAIFSSSLAYAYAYILNSFSFLSNTIIVYRAGGEVTILSIGCKLLRQDYRTRGRNGYHTEILDLELEEG